MDVTTSDSSTVDYSYNYDDAYRLTSESYNTGVGDVTTTNPTNETGLNSALAAASGQAQVFLDQVNAIQADLEAERDRLAEELANCNDLKRDCNGDGTIDEKLWNFKNPYMYNFCI
jgi:hypothetical protein